jgi:hypothetical protein
MKIMLKCNDVVVVKDESGKVVSVVPYERTYYAFGAGDQTEEVEVTANGKTVGTKVRPTGKTTHDSQSLFAEMVADFQAQDGESDPIARVLSECEYSADLGQRNAIRARAKSEAEGPEKAIEAAVKKLLVAIPGLTAAQARAMIETARAQ